MNPILISQKNVYEFNLLLCGSHDGMKLKVFDKLCLIKGPTLVEIKVESTDHVNFRYKRRNFYFFFEYIKILFFSRANYGIYLSSGLNLF